MSEAPDRPDWDDREFDIMVPFTCVESENGPYEDKAFVAGFQIGCLHNALSQKTIIATTFLIYSELIDQADLIAMMHGYTTDVLNNDGTWAQMGAKRNVYSDFGGI